MSVDRSIHLVAFNVPFPADYGGAIDVFYKIKALHQAGISIRLHCFQYGRAQAKVLESYCESVHYYPRLRSPRLLFNRLPYIVCTRSSDELRSRLLNDNLPIVMEGLHSTLLLNDGSLSGRKVVVRTHNIEHDYYRGLEKAEQRFLKKSYLHNEAKKLERYEQVLSKASAVAAISPPDMLYFQQRYANAFYLPAFHPFETIETDPFTGDYAFYHGNLAVAENDEAALFLTEEVLQGLSCKLIIAGSHPTERLRKAVEKSSNVELKTGLSPEEIHGYIARAKVNVLPTFQSTGIKLKLLASLFLGKTCLVNTPMVKGTGLENLCMIADGREDFRKQLTAVFNSETWNDRMVKERREILESGFSNRSNVRILVNRLFD